jgi:hypothetical protein
MLELGPDIGAPTEHTRIKVGVGVCGTAVARNEDLNVPDVTASTTISRAHTRNAFNPSLHAAVTHIAQDLGDFWPKPEARRERA